MLTLIIKQILSSKSKLVLFMLFSLVFTACGLRSYHEVILRNDFIKDSYDSYEIPIYVNATEKVVKKKSEGLSSSEFEKVSGMKRTISQALWEEIGVTVMMGGVNQLLKLGLIGIKDKEFEIPIQELAKKIISDVNEKYKFRDYSTQFKEEKEFRNFVTKNNEKLFIFVDLTYCNKVQGEYNVTSRGTSIITTYYYIPAISARVTAYALDGNQYKEVMMRQTMFFTKVVKKSVNSAYFEKKEVIFNRAVNSVSDTLNKFLDRQYSSN